jgi:capping protein (actin filament) muscle Z-line, alpha
MSDLSPQEKIKIANGFMLNAPPGEFMEVVTDVRGLLEDDSIINDTAPATFRQYNTDQMLQVQRERGERRVAEEERKEKDEGNAFQKNLLRVNRKIESKKN